MIDRHSYLLELIEYILKKHLQISLDITESGETLLPKALVDLKVKIPKEKLPLVRHCPIPVLSEVTLFELKAYTDNLTGRDLMQALGELYVIGASQEGVGKTTSLVILSTGKPKKLMEEEGIHRMTPLSQWPWIYRIEAKLPAHLFVMDEVPTHQENHAIFMPFQSVGKVKRAKDYFEKIQEKKPILKEFGLILFWLSKLYPNLYKEIGKMATSNEEIVKTIAPEVLERWMEKGMEKGREEGEIKKSQEDILEILEARFGKIKAEIAKQVKAIADSNHLTRMIRLAATCESLEGFEVGM